MRSVMTGLVTIVCVAVTACNTGPRVYGEFALVTMADSQLPQPTLPWSTDTIYSDTVRVLETDDHVFVDHRSVVWKGADSLPGPYNYRETYIRDGDVLRHPPFHCPDTARCIGGDPRLELLGDTVRIGEPGSQAKTKVFVRSH